MGRSGQAGLTGVSMKAKTKEKWFFALPFSESVSTALKIMVKIDGADASHHEDNTATQKYERKS